MVLKYDRRASEPMLKALEPGGFAHGLVQYGRSGMYGLDLQLRGKWATLYIGTTKALDLHAVARGNYILKTHKTYANRSHLRWNQNWSDSHTGNWFSDNWAEVEAYLDRVIPWVSSQGKHIQEGMVQSALSRFPGNGITTIDREAVVSYANEVEKRQSLACTSRPWVKAAHREDGAPRWWSGSKLKLSTECDLLGIMPSGALATIEVKPASAGASAIAWSPLQALQYASQFQAWLDVHPEGAVGIVNDLMLQQQRIGMREPGTLPVIDSKLPVQAVVILDSRTKETGLSRMAEVISHLGSMGKNPQVEVYLSNLAGRISPLKR